MSARRNQQNIRRRHGADRRLRKQKRVSDSRLPSRTALLCSFFFLCRERGRRTQRRERPCTFFSFLFLFFCRVLRRPPISPPPMPVASRSVSQRLCVSSRGVRGRAKPCSLARVTFKKGQELDSPMGSSADRWALASRFGFTPTATQVHASASHLWYQDAKSEWASGPSIPRRTHAALHGREGTE